MPLTATVILRRGRYEASGPDDRFPEALPSPFRLFSALVAVAGREGNPADNAGLKWLELQPPPTIIRPPLLDQGRTEVYFVTNARDAKGGSSLTHPGRSTNLKHRSWVNFAGDRFHFVWGETPDAETLASLRALAGGVTYMGRVEGPVTVHVDDRPPTLTADDQAFEPVSSGHGTDEVATPYPGSLDALVDVFDHGESAWQAARTVSYAPPTTDSQPAARQLASMLVYRIEGRPVRAGDVLDLTSALRAAVLSRVKQVTGPDGIPASVHGHQPDSPHVAYLALPTVGHSHADGLIRGLAVALPRDMTEQDRRVLGMALDVEGALTSISYGRVPKGPDGLRKLDVHRVLPGEEIRTTSAAAWEAPQGSDNWATATPLMLNRHPHRRDNPAELVARSVVEAGYPEPVEVELGDAPFLPGAVRYRKGWQQALGGRPARPVFHAALRFPEPVRGPLMVGALRFVGGGLFWPMSSWAGSAS